MSSLTFGLLLLGLAATTQCISKKTDFDIPIKFERGSRALQARGINVFDVLKKLDICYLKCKENYCECCQKIKILFIKIEVCGTADITPAEKIAQIGLKVSGLKVLSTKVKLERHVCRSISSKIGPVEVCVDTNVLENELRTNSFPVCFKIQVSYEGIPSALFTVGCPESKEAINEQGGEYHSVATVKVLNGDQVAKAIQKIAAGGKAKKV